MAREQMILKATGLATYADLLSRVPEGSLSTAKNVVIDKEGLISPRRGFEKLDAVSDLGYISSMHTFEDKIWIHRDDDDDDTADTLSYYTGSAWTDLVDTIAAPSDVNKIRSIEFNKSIYFTSNTGVQKLDTTPAVPAAGDLVDAGAPKALNVTASLNSTSPGSAIPLATTTYAEVAYRVVWGYKDANDILILGAPSQREIFQHTDTGNPRDIDLVINIPDGITTSWFYQVYRSDAGQDVSASDQLRLAYEGNPSSGEITARQVSITDIQPEALLGIELYTNATQEGILKANNEPPKCRDIALYQNHAFYANTESKYNLEIQLLGTGTDALQTTDTITIDDIVYEAKYYYDTQLGGNLTDSATTVVLLDGSNFLENDVVKIGNEDILLGSRSTHTFTGCTRGVNNTTAAAHFYNSANFTAADTDICTSNGHGMANGTKLRVTTSAADLPAGLSIDTDYYVINTDTNTFKLSEKLGGTAVDITDAGTGTHTFTTRLAVEITEDPHQGTEDGETSFAYTGIDTDTDSITSTDHGLIAGNKVRVYTTGTLSTDLTADTDYYVLYTDANTFQLSATKGGAAIDFTDQGTGTYTVRVNAFFVLYVSASPADDVEDTAKSLIRVINTKYNNNIEAIYSSDTSSRSTDLPGQILLTEDDFTSAVDFTVSATGTKVDTTWTPKLASTGQTATNDKKENRVYYSKFQQPEAVPALNYFDVGPANDKILRILPLRESLMIFTETGIYRLYGTTESSFQVVLLDNTSALLAPDSAVTLNNQVYGLFDQGVAAVGSSVNIISRVIEGKFLKIRGELGSDITSSFGIGYESDRKYILFVKETSAASTPDIAYVFNTVTNAWTTYDLSKTAGIVNPADDLLYLSAEDLVSKERKNFNETDIADEQIDCTVSAVSTTTLTLDSGAIAAASVGDIFKESAGIFSKIQSIDSVNNTITVLDDLGYSTGAAEILKFYEIEIVWNPVTCDHPALLKQFSEATMLTNLPMEDFDLSFGGLTDLGFDTVSFTSLSLGNWGLDPWGSSPWGGEIAFTRYRTYVPLTKQRDTAIIIKLEQDTAYNDFEISGFVLYYRNIGPRSER